MASLRSYLSGWLLLLCVTFPAWKTEIYSLTKSEILCQMVKKMCCHGRFFYRIVATCNPEGSYIPHRGFHGNNCSRDDECIIQDSVCYAGVCLCRLGLYFSPSQNTCVTECVEFGCNMDFYPGVGIYSNNIEGRKNMTLFACSEMCVHQKSYQCRSLDFNDGTCLLSVVGFLDVSRKERDFNALGWTFGQQQCGQPLT